MTSVRALIRALGRPLGVVLVLSAAMATAPASARADGWGETYKLGNGLRVVLSPDPRFPSVTVLVRYHVGARQEALGRSGIAHLLEHFTFRVPRPPVKSSAYSAYFTVSSRNGTTDFEETNYFTTTASGDLKYAVWTERWRMGLNLDHITETVRRQELDIVKNERRQRLEITPYSAGEHRLWTELFPLGHPFHDRVIGSMKDLESITLDEAKAFFTTWYGPANATLAVVGDFDPQEARAVIDEYFGHLPAGAPPPPRAASPRAITKEIVIRHAEEYGRTPRLQMAWHTPGRYTEEHAAAEVTAMLLGGLDASRLVMGVPEAVTVSARQIGMFAGSVLVIEATPRPGVSFEALHRKIEATLEILRKHPPPEAQLDCAVRRMLRDRFRQMEDSLAKAHLLIDVLAGAGAEGDPLAFEKKRLMEVKPEDVQRFVNKYLGASNRVVVYAAPVGGQR